MDTKAIIFRADFGGLANRLRALVCYQAVSRLLDVPFYLCWLQTEGCDASFSDLFQNRLSLIDPVECSKLIAENTAVEYSHSNWFLPLFNLTGIGKVASKGQFMKAVYSCLRELRPHEEILRRADEFCSHKDLSRAVGFHIRHTDNPFHIRHTDDVSSFQLAQIQPLPPEAHLDLGKVPTIEGFLREITAVAEQGASIFLATDDQNLELELKTRFEGRIISFPKAYQACGKRTSSIQDALTEMLLLMRCERLIGTYYSSFSKFAAFWGEIPYAEIQGTECVAHPGVARTLAEFRKMNERGSVESAP